MARKLICALAATTALTILAPAMAQDTTSTAQDAASRGQGFSAAGDIIVTARRTNEKLQDVPVSVVAVTSAQIKKLSILSLPDATKLAPGLSITSTQGPGSEPVIVLRGVRWTDAAGTPAVPIYLNEINFDPSKVLFSMYDLGDIQVLRGPQGTTRGANSIAGAVLVSSKVPDLDQIGGFADGLAGSAKHYNVQAGLSVPIIKDRLAIRVAGLYEDSEGNRVHSVNDPEDPSVKTRSGRVTLLAKPTDTIRLTAMYQYTYLKNRSYNQVEGTGSPGFTSTAEFSPATIVVPANYNGPPLSSKDYKAVEDSLLNTAVDKVSLVTVNATWDVLGQRLSYNFGYQHTKNAPDQGNQFSTDPGNQLVGYNPIEYIGYGRNLGITHEVRLSSQREPGRFFDYDVGAYYQRAYAFGLPVDEAAAFLPGAFGYPLVGASDPQHINAAAAAYYTLPIALSLDILTKKESVYGNVQFHLPYGFELSGGVRAIKDRFLSRTVGDIVPSQAGVPAVFIPGGACIPGAVPASPIYGDTVCDSPIPGSVALNSLYDKTNKPVIYNVSLSKKFGPDILAYFTTGTSYRSGVGNISINTNDPALLTAKPEYATSYEVGLKTTLLQHKLRLNVDLFQINYKDQLTQDGNIEYLDIVSQPGTAITAFTGTATYANVDSRVRGVEGEIGYSPIRGLDLGGNISYAKITATGGSIPCNDPNTPLTPTHIINFCNVKKGEVLNAIPLFQANVTGSYEFALTSSIDAYVRTLINYQGHNPNFGFDVDNKRYALVDLFIGIAKPDGGWDLGVYAKNLFNEKRELTRQSIGALPDSTGGTAFASSGYSTVTATLPREIGVTLRYAFGSR